MYYHLHTPWYNHTPFRGLVTTSDSDWLSQLHVYRSFLAHITHPWLLVSDIVCFPVIRTATCSSMRVDLVIHIHVHVHVASFYVCNHGGKNCFVVFKTVIMTKQHCAYLLHALCILVTCTVSGLKHWAGSISQWYLLGDYICNKFTTAGATARVNHIVCLG